MSCGVTPAHAAPGGARCEPPASVALFEALPVAVAMAGAADRDRKGKGKARPPPPPEENEAEDEPTEEEEEDDDDDDERPVKKKRKSASGKAAKPVAGKGGARKSSGARPFWAASPGQRD